MLEFHRTNRPKQTRHSPLNTLFPFATNRGPSEIERCKSCSALCIQRGRWWTTVSCFATFAVLLACRIEKFRTINSRKTDGKMINADVYRQRPRYYVYSIDILGVVLFRTWRFMSRFNNDNIVSDLLLYRIVSRREVSRFNEKGTNERPIRIEGRRAWNKIRPVTNQRTSLERKLSCQQGHRY